MASISDNRAQVLFSLADTNSDGQLNTHEVQGLFDTILMRARIDVSNNDTNEPFQGFGVNINTGMNFNLQEFTTQFIAWGNHVSQLIRNNWLANRNNGRINVLGGGSPITPQQALRRIKRVINHMNIPVAPPASAPNPNAPIANVVQVNIPPSGSVEPNVPPPPVPTIANTQNSSNLPMATNIQYIRPVSTPAPSAGENKVSGVANCPICQFPINGPPFADASKPQGNETLGCGHTYHRHCINALRHHNISKCPLCQKPFVGGRKVRKKRRRKSRRKKSRKTKRRRRPFLKKSRKNKQKRKEKKIESKQLKNNSR